MSWSRKQQLSVYLMKKMGGGEERQKRKTSPSDFVESLVINIKTKQKLIL